MYHNVRKTHKPKNDFADATPVINDREMIDPESLLSGQRKRGSSRGKGDHNRTTPSNLMPSHIGDLDMLRVREAEKVLLQEEMINGRLIRDQYGRLVPEALHIRNEAEKEALDGKSPSSKKGKRNGKKRKKKKGNGEDDENEDDELDTSGKGHLRAKKEGGRLQPLSRRGVGGKKTITRKPRSRAARMDMDIRKARQENVRLQQEIERLKSELEKDEAEVRARVYNFV